MRMSVLLTEYVCATCLSPLMEVGGKAICRKYPDLHFRGGYSSARSAEWLRENARSLGQEFLEVIEGTTLAKEFGLGARPIISKEQLSQNNRVLHGDHDGLF